jgi:hypothetical protein
MTTEQATIEALRRWSHVLLWVSIVLPVFGAVAAGARYYVERRANQLAGRVTASAIAQAQLDAAAARSELSHLKERTSPRRLSPEQRLAMRPLLQSLKGHQVAFACRMMDGESCDYATELAQFFLDAGCQVPEPIKTSVNDLPGYIAITNHGKSDKQVAQLVKRSLDAGDIPSRIEEIKENSVGIWYDDVVHVVVGRKKPE